MQACVQHSLSLLRDLESKLDSQIPVSPFHRLCPAYLQDRGVQGLLAWYVCILRKLSSYRYGVWVKTVLYNFMHQKLFLTLLIFNKSTIKISAGANTIVKVASQCHLPITQANHIQTLGALAPLVSITLVRTVSFSIYQNAKYKYSAAIGRLSGTEEPLVVVNRPGSIPTIGTVACFGAAGATAGGIITAIAC